MHAGQGPALHFMGCKPDPAQTFSLDLRPVASLKSLIVKMKQVPQNTPVSYGGHYATDRTTVIATIALGYGARAAARPWQQTRRKY